MMPLQSVRLSSIEIIALGSSMLLFLGCGGLPENFKSLPLHEKVSAYEDHFRTGGQPLEWAREEIARHGWEAADLMTHYLDGTEHGLTPHEAISIIAAVQLGGCKLRDTKTHKALEAFRDQESPDSLAKMVADSTLDLIRQDVVLGAEVGGFSTGPCAESLSAGEVY